MTEEEKTFEEIKKDAGLAELAEDDTAIETTEKKSEEEEIGPLEENIESEFPDQEINEISKESDEEIKESKKKSINKQQAWIDFKTIDLKQDAKAILKRPFYIIVLILGMLLLILFIAMFFEYKATEYAKRLDGYVKNTYKIPDWHKGELPEHLKEFLHNYEAKKKKIAQEKTIIHPDPRANEEIIGRSYPKAINNETLLKILKKQKIGEVTAEGVVKTEKMNLSGLDMSKVDYKYFRNMVSSNLMYTSFNGIEEEGLLFRGASLQFSQFVDAAIIKTNFVRSRLSYANFFESISDNSLFNNAIAEKAHFQSARSVNSNFNSAIFLKSDFSNSILDGITAKYSNWEGTSFREASLIGANFKEANLRGVSFVEADLSNVNFEGAKLEGANFTGANLLNTNFKNADVAQVNFLKVKNASFNQLNQASFLLSAKAIPEELVPKKKSWKERFIVPHDHEF